MRIPDPYFEGVPCYGDLRMEEIIVDYVYPLLSVLKDSKSNRYLCMCFDTRGAQQWLITPISSVDLIKLLKNLITLSMPFETPGKKILATRDYEKRIDSFSVLNAKEIPRENLPAAGEYLDSEDDEWKEYIERIACSSLYIPVAIKCRSARVVPQITMQFDVRRNRKENWIETAKYGKRLSDCYAW